MKKVLLGLIALLIAFPCYAQCVAEVKDVIIDPKTGNLAVKVEYTYEGEVVDNSLTPCEDCVATHRYNEETGTLQEIVAKAKDDIESHCKTLIKRNAKPIIRAKIAEIQSSKIQDMVDTIKQNAVGWTKTVNEASITFKGKEITFEADGSYTVTDAN